MADALTTVTKIINSPPGQLAAGGVLAGIVWKFFERVEAVLTDQTKVEIAVWLVGVEASGHVKGWSSTFLSMFNRVFGEIHPSKFGFIKYLFATSVASVIDFVLSMANLRSQLLFRPSLTLLTRVTVPFVVVGYVQVLILILFGYLILCLVRWVILQTSSYKHGRMLAIIFSTVVSIMFGLILVILEIVTGISELRLLVQLMPPNDAPPQLLLFLQTHKTYSQIVSVIDSYQWMVILLQLLPLFLGTLWLDLYAFSGFLLKAARRFDIGFDWFNRHFDIEKHPLQSIGLVAGALVAFVYWTAVIVSRVVG